MSRKMFCVFAISRCLTPCDCHLGIFHPSIALAAGDLSMRLRIRAKTLTILYFISSIELVEGDQKYPLTKRLCWKTYFLHVFVLFFHCLFALLSCHNFFCHNPYILALRNTKVFGSMAIMIFYRSSFEQISPETCQFRVSN